MFYLSSAVLSFLLVPSGPLFPSFHTRKQYPSISLLPPSRSKVLRSSIRFRTQEVSSHQPELVYEMPWYLAASFSLSLSQSFCGLTERLFVANWLWMWGIFFSKIHGSENAGHFTMKLSKSAQVLLIQPLCSLFMLKMENEFHRIIVTIRTLFLQGIPPCPCGSIFTSRPDKQTALTKRQPKSGKRKP